MKFLITGGCGFLGTNISEALLKQNKKLIIFDNLSRIGSEQNLDWLKHRGEFRFINGDIRNQNDIEAAIIAEQPDVVIHLAGQVAMTTSIENPRK